MLSYEGIFFEDDMVEIIHSLEKNKLPKTNDKIHCTFKYHPTKNEIFNEIVGKSFELYLIGYGNNGNNSGFEISLPKELKKYYKNFEKNDTQKLVIPHITASLSENGEACDTKNLKFSSLQKPVKLTGRFGYWIKEENNEYLSFEPYKIN